MIMSGLSLVYLLINRLPCNENQLTAFKAKLDQFVYPLGMIPANAITNNDAYKQHSVQENIEYFADFTEFLFDDVYSTEEINIINIYLGLLNLSGYTLDDDVIDIVSPLIQIHSNKEEIEYCLDEIRYKYLIHLIYSKVSSDEIQPLIAQLSAVEDAHNSLTLERTIDNNGSIT